jgi:cation:H+ antiporter
MLLDIVLLIVGFGFVIKGADLLIDGASSLAKRFSIPEIVIGLTIVAFGTSAPELVVNIFASLRHSNEMVLGNIIGSNVFNSLLILGIAGMIFPIAVQRKTVWREIPFSLAAVVVLFFMANDNMFGGNEVEQISRTEGMILLVFFVMFLLYVFFISKDGSDELHDVEVYTMTKTVLFVLLGLAGLFIGGQMVVDNAVNIARAMEVSEKLIALTIVSGGTSLPELVTSAVAATKRRCDMAVGNVVGSNIFNILLVMGSSSVVYPVKFNRIFNVDIAFVAGSAVFLFLTMFTGKKRKLDRWEAAVLLVVYVIYMYYVIARK